MQDEIGQGKQEGYALGDDRRQGGARNAHARPGDEDIIQEDVQHRGNGDEKRGQLGLTQTAEDGPQAVVAIDEDHAEAAGAVVAAGVRPHRRGRVEKLHHQVRQHQAHDAQRHGGKEGDGQQRADGAADVLLLPRAHLLAQQDLAAEAEGHADHHDEHLHEPADARCGQAARADIVAHDEHVHHIVEGLEDVAHDDGNGIGHKLPEQGPLGHVPDHGFFHGCSFGVRIGQSKGL